MLSAFGQVTCWTAHLKGWRMAIIGRGSRRLSLVIHNPGNKAESSSPVSGTGRWLSALHFIPIYSPSSLVILTTSKGNRNDKGMKTRSQKVLFVAKGSKQHSSQVSPGPEAPVAPVSKSSSKSSLARQFAPLSLSPQTSLKAK